MNRRNSIKNIIIYVLIGIPIFLYACNSASEGTVDSMPTNLKVKLDILGVSSSTPYGDSSGRVNIIVSSSNAGAFQIILPNKQSYTITGTSGTALCEFASTGGVVTTYPVTIKAYNGNSIKDTIVNITLVSGHPLRLVWSDEFDGDALNTLVWNYDIGNNNGWGNNEKQYYTSDIGNTIVRNGYLEITAKNEIRNGFNYTSARLTTQNKKSFMYGKIDIRAKLPSDRGTWPALWMLGNNITDVGWPSCGEIDIMEMGTVTGLNNILASLHSGQDKTQQKVISTATTDFHIYSLDWQMDHITFYIDSVLFYSVPNTNNLPFYNKSFFFLFNVAVGGNLGGNSIALGQYATMYVDYIRVYQ